MPHLRFGDRKIFLPGNRIARIVIGVLLILGGFLAILPIFGMWMIPAGLIVLSVDIPVVRRWRRRTTVRLVLEWRKFRNWLHRRFGIGRHVSRRTRQRKTTGPGLHGAG
jgi:hypothetical protein